MILTVVAAMTFGRSSVADTSYLSDMPAVASVQAKIRGSDPIDTQVRLYAAFIELCRIVHVLSDAGEFGGRMSPEEEGMCNVYRDAASDAAKRGQELLGGAKAPRYGPGSWAQRSQRPSPEDMQGDVLDLSPTIKRMHFFRKITGEIAHAASGASGLGQSRLAAGLGLTLCLAILVLLAFGIKKSMKKRPPPLALGPGDLPARMPEPIASEGSPVEIDQARNVVLCSIQQHLNEHNYTSGLSGSGGSYQFTGSSYWTNAWDLTVRNGADRDVFVALDLSLKNGDTVYKTAVVTFDRIDPGQNFRQTFDPLTSKTIGSYFIDRMRVRYLGKVHTFPVGLCLGSPSSSNCFVVTACFGSTDDPYVEYFRDLRERRLRPSRIGRLAIAIYHRVGPPLARFIEPREPLKGVARAFLRFVARALIGRPLTRSSPLARETFAEDAALGDTRAARPRRSGAGHRGCARGHAQETIRDAGVQDRRERSRHIG